MVTTGHGRSEVFGLSRYRYFVPPPEIITLTPNKDKGSPFGGETVTISGTGLAGTTAVSFGGTKVTPEPGGADTSLTVVTPDYTPAGRRSAPADWWTCSRKRPRTFTYECLVE